MKSQPKYSLLHNSRFYILAFAGLLSVAVFAWLRLSLDDDQLLHIRAQQIYGFICIVLWYLALIISPVTYIIGKQRLKQLIFSRRAIGVAAFYFAFLHTAIALFGQLGGPGQLQYLPDLFKLSLAGGAVGLLILAIMAATSFDRVIKFMTFRKWKWLHRLVYVAGILVIIHVWTIGTHVAYGGVQLVGFIALALLSGLEILRAMRLLNRKILHLRRAEIGVFALCAWAVSLISIAALPALIENYHSRHTSHDHSQEVR